MQVGYLWFCYELNYDFEKTLYREIQEHLNARIIQEKNQKQANQNQYSSKSVVW